MDTFEWSQEIPHIGPHAFGRVAMDFANAITVIISCILMGTVRDTGVCPNDVVVTRRLIGVDAGFGLRKAMHLRFQGFSRRVRDDSQADLPAVPADRPDNRWPVIGVGAPSALVIGSKAGRIERIGVLASFFPPHSETSRRFQSGYRGLAYWVATVGHSLAHLGVTPRWSVR